MSNKRSLFSGESASLLLDYLRPQRGQVILLALLLLVGIGLQLVNPQIVRFFIDTAQSGSGLQKLFGAAALFIGIAIVNQGVRLATTYLGENVAWTATNLLRADLALHCLKLDMSFHKQYKAGELIERVDGDVNQLANYFSQLIVRLGSNLLLVAGVLLLFWWQDWRIGLSISVVALIGAVVLRSLNQRTVPRWQALREADAQLFGFLEEWLNGTEEIQTNAAEPYVMRRLYESLRERWQRILGAMRIQVLVSDLPLGTFALAYAAAHILGNQLFQNGGMTIGEVYLIFYYLDVMKEPLWEIVRQVEDLQRAAASIRRINELREIRPTILDGPGVVIPQGPIAVTFDDVDFHYEDDAETIVLKQICFALRPGTVLGVLGRTGSGKSTLTKLLYRFHDPTAGRICVGDGAGFQFDIRQARQTELRRHIGMVTQDVQLFHATVRHNLTLFDDEINDERILSVLEEVGLGVWLAELPQGLDTPLEAAGQGLSAGQAQLLALARVFLADPGLIILDEASSRLDPATEHLIEKSIDRLLANRTGIIVAHRLATVQRADEIMILEGGRISEHGDRLQLAGDPDSQFHQLLRTGLEEVIV